ncbi:alkaline phosphatase PafA [Autumnicola psychrophila]|uniref:Alkaline phosphatase PafA n=1 Tax=Autumnicola psychrophila TaxID=3075592 RepID=A0ABU3DRH2_9FLAO|nr:alkaline phosphatase PafA [Zunongwangia sp. F225]MDT0686319.1 alkaline phosphatase PafA [Zunongwangia sp. F225]
MIRIFFSLLTTICTFSLIAQESDKQKTRLVVGIVVDQMRYDYFTRFGDRYGDEGFKRLINEGYSFKNNHFNYVPTYTAPGHASVYTGTGPANHGIIGNNWYSKFEDELVYCTGDESVRPVGTISDAGEMSPHRMKVTTVADQNRLHTQMRGKTIGVSIKDRGSILPAGHTANAAYWFHGKDEGKFITSSFYLEELPQWVKDFNNSNIAESYFKTWNTLYPIESYTASGVDINNFEYGFKGEENASFPYDLAALRSSNNEFDLITNTPFGNDLTLEFALAAIKAEELGQDEDTDFLTLSFSSTDKVGHNFGVNSKEIEDTYLRLDKNIATLLQYLDENVGKGAYTIFLTSDHGGGDVSAYLESLKIPAGYFDSDNFTEKLNEFVVQEFGEANLISKIYNDQVFFNYQALYDAEINADELEEKIAHYILQQEQIDKVYTRSQLEDVSYTDGMAAAIQEGFNQKRSGDVIYVLDPAVVSYSEKGSMHGSGFTYDTHAPLIFFGNGIDHGSTTERSEIVDIAPTISALLGIAFPNAATGKPLYQMLDRKSSE